MVDLLARGLHWLQNQRHRHLTQVLRYRRGTEERRVRATIGRTVFRLDLGHGITERIEARDYIITARKLRAFGDPKPGDQIIETKRGKRYTAEVMAPGGEPAWRWADADRRAYRIHTKHLRTEAL